MRAVIPVAGVGTRLRPHTYSLPKVLLNVAGNTILGHILDAIKEQGINKATIITGYMGKSVEEYVNSHYDMEVDFILQEDRKGLGHAIWMGRETYNEPLMIILGDTIFEGDLSLAWKSGMSSLGVKKVDDPRRFGVVETDEDGYCTNLVEKPEEFVSDLALVGIYYVTNTKGLVKSLQDLMDREIKTKNEYQLTDTLQLMIESGEKFTTFPVEGWFDCGKPETMLETNQHLLEKNHTARDFRESIIIPPVYIAKNADIQRSVIGPYATIAEGATVKDSIVRNSILSNRASVTSALLEDSIIGNDAVVNGHFHNFNVGSSSEINFTH